jgi:hypothetical protein
MADKELFGVEHVKRACRDILMPPLGNHELLRWGFRLNGLDMTSSHDYRWPFPGHWAAAPGPFTTGGNGCPPKEGDGLCIAKTISGAQSGNGRFGKSLGLLVAFAEGDVLAEVDEKLRVKRAWVADMFDPVAALVLSGANLSGVNLSGANLSGARYSAITVWPEGFDPKGSGCVLAA